jgi:dUTP pyrophosphatase
MQLKIKRLRPGVQLPQPATAGAACFDLVANPADGKAVWIQPGGRRLIGTGLAVEFPQGLALMLYSRSGHGLKHGICLANGTGIIDSDYRDEVGVVLANHGEQAFEVKPGDRIAQAMLTWVPEVQLVDVETLGETERQGGFGSTGA